MCHIVSFQRRCVPLVHYIIHVLSCLGHSDYCWGWSLCLNGIRYATKCTSIDKILECLTRWGRWYSNNFRSYCIDSNFCIYYICIILYHSQINHLQRIQNSAARIVSRRPRHEHITPVLENLHWLPVQQRIMFKVVLFVFKCLNGLAPPYLAELITVKENSCSCQLRSDGCLQEKKTNNKFGDRAFSICGPVLWNRLPKSMKEINSLDKFKRELKTHLFKEAFG